MSAKKMVLLNVFGLFVIPLLFSTGCNLIAAPLSILAQDQTKKVPAEYGNLSGKTVCLWVWADESLLFEYPIIRLDVANHARHFIKQHVKNVKIVDPSVVDKFQRNEYDADSMPVVQVGKRFKADVVLFIQVSDFVTRPSGSPNLFQGRMTTQCALYDCKGDLPPESSERKLWGSKIEVVFPERPVGMMDTDDLRIRATLLELFGESIAKKFYDYQAPARESGSEK
jgi:hypothetical protein